MSRDIQMPIALDDIDVPDGRRAADVGAVKKLAVSIEEIGLRHPVTLRRKGERYILVTGRHRLEAFRSLGREHVPAIISSFGKLEAELWEIDENLCRNDLTAAERASAQSRRKSIYQQLHPETKHGANQTPCGQFGQTEVPRFDEAAADATGQSERSVRRDVTRAEVIGDVALAKVARTSLDKGDELDALAKLPEQKRGAIIDRAAAGEKVSAKVELKKDQRESKEKILGVVQRALPDKRYGVILADPEWRFEVYSRDTGMDRAADNHYPTSATDAICARPVGDIAAKDCALFLWATVPMLPDALRVMDAWGFQYKSHCIWAKDRPGTGYWFRNMHELLLVGTRGDVPAPAMGTQAFSFQPAPLGEHSAKPECFLEMIEAYFPTLPKIELNRRGPARPGWDAWGNETVDPETGEITTAKTVAAVEEVA